MKSENCEYCRVRIDAPEGVRSAIHQRCLAAMFDVKITFPASMPDQDGWLMNSVLYVETEAKPPDTNITSLDQG